MTPRDVPAVALWLLERTVPQGDLEAVVGDLVEVAGEEGRGRAWMLGQAAALAVGFSWARVAGRVGRVGRTSIRGILQGGGGMDGWWKDLRVAARSLARRPGFSAIVVVTLALGIGANTAIFSVLRGAVLFDLPYHEPARVLWHSDGYREWGGWGSSMSLPNLLDLRERSSSLESMEFYEYRSVNLATDDRPERALSLEVGPDFLRVLGMRPALGRDFTTDDNRAGGADVVLLGHDLWEERFGADPGVVGRTVLLNATPHTVVGVLPEAFTFRNEPRLLLPLGYEGGSYSRLGRGFNAISRLADGATLEGARAELAGIFATLEEAYPDANEGWTTFAHPIREFMVPQSARSSLRLLSAAVMMVLLIACVNVANLLLVRAESRQRELAVRVALGAGRGRLMPVFLGESLLLGVLGGAVGVGLAWLAVPALVALMGSTLPRADTITLDGAVLAFGAALSLVVGVAVGALPVLRADVRGVAGRLKEGTRAVSRGGQRLRQALVVTEVGLSVVLVAAAALLLKSFWRLSDVDTGLREPEQVLVTTMVLSPGAYDGPASWDAFFDGVVESVQRMPGVLAAGTTNRLPMNGGYNVTDMFAFDDRERVSHFVEIRYVTTGFFDALGIGLVAGRHLEDADGDARGNVVATEALARELFGSPADAVGQSIIAGGWTNPVRIVGVVSDIRDMGVTRRPPPGIYYVYGPETNPGYGAILTVRTAGDPMDALPGIRQAVGRIDPTVPLYGSRLLSDVVAQTVGTQRFSTSLFGLFAALAIVLGAVGIYGVMAYTVSERTRELGVRMALGARAGEVVGMVLRDGVRLTVVGLVLGVGAALAGARFLTDLLYEVDARDPVVYGGVVGVLLLVAAAACWVPARRASAVDPVEALRQE